MKAITVCQPYAHLIALDEKRVENRTWPTRYRGPILIHAGKSLRWAGGLSKADLAHLYGRQLAFGAVVATATLAACLPLHEVLAGKHDAEFPWLSTHKHVAGPWCWVLDDIKAVSPVPMNGRQGLFELPWGPNGPACRVCGCTENHACPGGCHWVESDLCSVCWADENLPF